MSMYVIEPILNKNNTENLQNAIETARDGKATRVEVDGFLVYRCGTIIRIDIKGVFNDNK